VFAFNSPIAANFRSRNKLRDRVPFDYAQGRRDDNAGLKPGLYKPKPGFPVEKHRDAEGAKARRYGPPL